MTGAAPGKKIFHKIYLRTSQDINLDHFIRELLDMGYTHADMVQDPGDFSLRGGLVDIFPADHEQPVRVDLDGIRVESIRFIDPDDGKRKEALEHLTIIQLDSSKAHRARRPHTDLPGISEVDSFFRVKRGDLVVHIDHGIGRYMGTRKPTHRNPLEFRDKDAAGR